MFASSITSAQGWDRKKGPVPEEILSDTSMAMAGGYSSSKYVSERVSTPRMIRKLYLTIVHDMGLPIDSSQERFARYDVPDRTDNGFRSAGCVVDYGMGSYTRQV